MIIHNGIIVNNLSQFKGYLIVNSDKIIGVHQGAPSKEQLSDNGEIIDAQGGFIMPGVIDDQVHFRDPGLTLKGDIASESRAAIAGGITSFMDMPNTTPATITIDLLQQKFEHAEQVSLANYSFYFGATNDNIKEITKLNPKITCGVKVFMGSSTGNMLVDREKTLSAIFAESPILIATHCEEESIVSTNLKNAFAKYGDNIPFELHPVIRSEEACYVSTCKAMELATKYASRLHVLHLTTAKEITLFDKKPLKDKKITAEVCAHHLWYSDKDYSSKGGLIKCNPAIKTVSDRDSLRQSLLEGQLDIIATDHAPHTWQEKQQPYTKCPSGLPMVQHSLVLMMEIFDVEQVVNFMSHRPSELFRINRRGYLTKGYYADIIIVKPQNQTITKDNVLYKCGWSSLENITLKHNVTHTIVNGKTVYQNGQFINTNSSQQLTFNK